MNTLFGKKNKYQKLDSTKIITKYNCEYYGWVLYPLNKNNNTFPFHNKKDLIKLAEKIAKKQTTKKQGIKATLNIFSRGFTINTKNKESPYPLLNITNRTLIYPWVSLVLSHKTKIVIIISTTRDIDTTLGVGFDVIKLTSKSKDKTHNILDQFEKLYCNNNWYTLNNYTLNFTDLYNLKPIIKRSWSENNIEYSEEAENSDVLSDINDESDYLEVESMPKN